MPNIKYPLLKGILDFWFSAEVEPFWFSKNDDFDTTIVKQYGMLYEEMAADYRDKKLDEIKSGQEALALVILFDQFSRNMFRNSPKAFATDDLALTISKRAVERGFDRELTSLAHHNFLYMPFMHSENLDDQEEGIRLFSGLPGNEQTVSYARHHRDIIAKFGRFPHRNIDLGRKPTPEEVEFGKTFTGF
ncbi:MAG: DUF924 domain-containing protein [Alphaproteobacteria bacterium]|nr:DUF924 domain-containing protein [Alphaproteobacteria bacterium]